MRKAVPDKESVPVVPGAIVVVPNEEPCAGALALVTLPSVQLSSVAYRVTVALPLAILFTRIDNFMVALVKGAVTVVRSNWITARLVITNWLLTLLL